MAIQGDGLHLTARVPLEYHRPAVSQAGLEQEQEEHRRIVKAFPNCKSERVELRCLNTCDAAGKCELWFTNKKAELLSLLKHVEERRA